MGTAHNVPRGTSEIDKCKDPLYFYKNYCLVDGKKPIIRDVDRSLFKKLFHVEH